MGCLLCLALALEARAQAFTDQNSGTSGAQFLKLGADAPAAGLAQAVRAIAEDASSLYWNPAGLARLDHHHATLTHLTLDQDVFYEFVAYAQPVPSPARLRRGARRNPLGSFGIALIYLNAGALTEADNTGVPTGAEFRPQDLAATLGWGVSVWRGLDLGLAGKYIRSEISGTASAWACDLGARLRLGPWGVPYALAAGVTNLGEGLKFGQEEDPLPLAFTVGNSFRPAKNWALTADAVFPRDSDPYVAFGSAHRFALSRSVFATLRVGYQRRTSSHDLDGFTGLATGGGVSLAGCSVDYAWTPYGALGDAHRLSLSWRFSGA